ncbi:MAG TPA: hypothetical protein VFG68_02785 [Fimbriiglobus sp.]|nr:hypothetical protein [Fimbriiglobus sp.]
MAAKTYPIGCECGATIHVPGTSAGTTFTCKCGRQVEIPGLARLKASIGQSTVSADLELEHLTAARALPLEANCTNCGRETTNEIAFSVVCERPEDKSGGSFWYQVFFIWFSPLLYMMHMATRQSEVHGRNVVFRLPVRVCETCQPSLNSQSAIRDTLRQTPVYARLLDKYPHARIGNAS